jgi:hypothetical protein
MAVRIIGLTAADAVGTHVSSSPNGLEATERVKLVRASGELPGSQKLFRLMICLFGARPVYAES